MPATAAATAFFTFDTWEEEPVVDDGLLRVHRTRFTKRWDGEITGRSAGEMLMVHVAGRPAAYCGFEWVTVTLAGRAGTFLLHHNAGAGLDGGLSLTVVPGSGAGQLAGLAGSARIQIAGEVGDTTAPHRLILEYCLG
jgi:Protein of unknown function (DUF3224)